MYETFLGSVPHPFFECTKQVRLDAEENTVAGWETNRHLINVNHKR